VFWGTEGLCTDLRLNRDPQLSLCYVQLSISLNCVREGGDICVLSRQLLFLMEEELECPICGEVFKQVVETPCCSRLFCRSCAEAWIAKSGSCASCREQITAEQLKPNKPFQRIVDNLPIKCPHSESGCTDKLTRGNSLRRWKYVKLMVGRVYCGPSCQM